LLGFTLAFGYAYVAVPKTYQASSTLVLTGSSGASLGSASSLASLAGLSLGGAGGGEADRMLDRVTARDFIIRLSDKLSFEDDPYLNVTLLPPSLKGIIRAKLTGVKLEAPTQADIIEAYVGEFRKAVDVSVSESGVIQVSMTHEDPKRSSDIVNAIVDQVLTDILNEKETSSHAQIEYLASELRHTQENVDEATQAIGSFSVENRMVSEQGLALVSSQLSDLRHRRERVVGHKSALAAISQMAKSGVSVTSDELNTLLNSYPNANDLEFRRLLGWAGDSATWVWPNTDQIANANRAIDQWLMDIERQISESETAVRNNADLANKLAKLQREAKVQQTVYEALLKQFEAQRASSGFQGAPGNIFEAAVPPTKPAGPRKSIYAVIGFLAGLILSSGVAITLSVRRGVLHTGGMIAETLGQRPWGTKMGRRLALRAKRAD
jgi:polysaccharide biosynthesis transport protein